MKNQPDTNSEEKLANIKQAAKELGLPDRVELPSPVQLAQIAAGFGIQTHPADAVRKAVALYVRAIAFKSKHDDVSVLELVSACDQELDSQLSHAALMAPLDQTFLLEPDKPHDQARRALAKGGLHLRKARSVLDNLRQWLRLDHMSCFLQKKNIPVTWNRKRLCWWKSPLESEVDETQAKLNRDHRAKCRMVTRKEYDNRKEAIAKKHGWTEAYAAREWKRILESMTEKRDDGCVVYRLPSDWLAGLIEWKKSLKHTGGVKSRQRKLFSENS